MVNNSYCHGEEEHKSSVGGRNWEGVRGEEEWEGGRR